MNDQNPQNPNNQPEFVCLPWPAYRRLLQDLREMQQTCARQIQELTQTEFVLRVMIHSLQVHRLAGHNPQSAR